MEHAFAADGLGVTAIHLKAEGRGLALRLGQLEREGCALVRRVVLRVVGARPQRPHLLLAVQLSLVEPLLGGDGGVELGLEVGDAPLEGCLLGARQPLLRLRLALLRRIRLQELRAQRHQPVVLATQLLHLFEELAAAHGGLGVLALETARALVLLLRRGRAQPRRLRRLQQLHLGAQLGHLRAVPHLGLAQGGARLDAGALEGGLGALGVAALRVRRLPRRRRFALQRPALFAPRRLRLLDDLHAHRLEVLLGEHVLRELDLGLLDLGGPLRTRLVVRVLGRRQPRAVRPHLLAKPHHLLAQLLCSLAEAVALGRGLAQRVAQLGGIVLGLRGSTCVGEFECETGERGEARRRQGRTLGLNGPVIPP